MINGLMVKYMEVKLQLPLDGMAKRQCLSIGINFHGLQTESNESNLAMFWGSISEDSALVTYLTMFSLAQSKERVAKKTGIWF